ncbi:unnamed protein product, partial [Gongylonema pulchrum]|uniref:Inner membrane protein n=1 Tax=Gongylonema pulchrum TaxID=637853 RepID=A0A183E7B6_9BILA
MKHERTILYSSVAVGALIAVIPVTQAIQYYGAHLIFFVCGILTAAATLLAPFAIPQRNLAYYYYWAHLIFFVCGILTAAATLLAPFAIPQRNLAYYGISFAACMATIGAVTSNWATIKQHGLFISALTSFSQIAGFIKRHQTRLQITAGHSSYKIGFLSETTKIRLFNSIALGASAVFMIALALVPQGYSLTGVILLTLTTSMYGFNGGGFNK